MFSRRARAEAPDRWSGEALAVLAVCCLALEVDAWPKPGLVSRIDPGSHADMDAGTFRRSAEALRPHFAALAEAGRAGAGMGRLRAIGAAAEADMLAATGGVNTHRGAIFGLGLLCAAAGRSSHFPCGDRVHPSWCLGTTVPALLPLPGEGVAAERRRMGSGGARRRSRDPVGPTRRPSGDTLPCQGRESRDGLASLTPGPFPRGRRETLGATVAALWGPAILDGPVPLHSHGAAARRRHGAGGARAEAAAGFPSLYATGLPALRDGRRLAPGDGEAARVHCCFALVAALEDTNLLHRGGPDGLAYARREARAFLARGGVGAPRWRDDAIRIHRAFVARRLSPGGSADLLAMTLFVDAWEAP